MESKYYKIEDSENGYSKYIRETELLTITIAFGAIEPKFESHNGKYQKKADEVILPCTRKEYLDKHYEYLSNKENINEPSII